MALAVAVAVARSALAISGGSPDNGAHPFVAMLTGPGASAPGCSGVLVRADNGALEVLTVAHCVYTPGGPRTGSGWAAQFGDTYSPSGPSYSGTFVVHGSYNPSVSNAHDLAVIVLSNSPPVTPAALAFAGKEDNQPDGSVTVVGTGQPHEGQRRVASELVSRRDGTWLYLRPGSGNSCDGDSGGPDLVPGTATVVALTDLGTCSSDQDLRVDTAEARQFLVTASQSAGAPAVTAQPSDQTVVVGGSAQFNAAASGSPSPAVQWQRSTNGGSSFADVGGATSTALAVTPAPSASGDQYRAVFSNRVGRAVSAAATLTVISDPGTGTAGLFHPLVPHRILDTRTTGGAVAAGADRRVAVLGTGGVPTAGVAAVVLAAAVPLPPGPGDLEIYPTGSRPTTRTSNLNWPRGRTVANLATVPVGNGGTVALSVSSGRVHVVVDVVGWYGDSSNQSGLRYTALTPTRVLDTGQSGPDIAVGADRRVLLRGVGGIPNRSDVTAVMLNLTVLGARNPVDIEVYPTGSAPTVRTSNTNLVAGQTAAVAVTAPLGADGSISISVARGTVRALVDVAGYYSASGDRFVPMTPARVVDRAGVTAGRDTLLVLAGRAGIPPNADAVLVNATGLDATHALDVSIFPAGQPPARRTSVLNLMPGQAVPNLVMARLHTGSVAVSASGGALRLILDAAGYMTSA